MTWTERGYARQVYSADPETGATTVLAEDAVAPVVTVTSSALIPAPQLHGELAISERSGWAQLWLVRPDAPKAGTPLTKGNWEVLSVDHIAEDGHDLIVTGVGREASRNPYWRALPRDAGRQRAFRTDPEPLTMTPPCRTTGAGSWTPCPAPSRPPAPCCATARPARSCANWAPPMTARGKRQATPIRSCFQGVAADGKTPIQGMILRPAHMDPALHYPVIDNVYTGPTTTDVPATFPTRIAFPAMAGAVGRDRGDDRRARHIAAGAKFPPARLPESGRGRAGRSYRADPPDGRALSLYGYQPRGRLWRLGGGYDAARFMLRRPEFFKVGIASSGNHELRLDKAWWPEVHGAGRRCDMGSQFEPVGGEEPEGQAAAGSWRHRRQCADHRQLPAGKGADRCRQGCGHGGLPNTRHAVYQPYYWKKFLDYFTLNLLGETPPAIPYTPTASHS
jgi:hypothetical protein